MQAGELDKLSKSVPIIYVTLTMAVLIIIATGVYVIRKKVLK